MRLLGLAPLLLVPSMVLVCCGGSTSGGGSTPDASGPDGATGGDAGPDDPGPPPLTSTSKVDVLFVVDDSSSMSDKSKLLGASAGALLRKLAPLADIHVGVIATSLGGMGGDVCPDSGNFQRLAHLQTKGPGGAGVPAASNGFLSFTSGQDVEALVADAEALVTGIGQTGCGFEAQLESAYRFLAQPDPWQSVGVDANNLGIYKGTDNVLLQQRAAFLRPDSIVAIVLLTDEDDSNVDPLSLGGQGWAFVSTQFPGSPVFRADGKTTTGPRGTSICQTNPGSVDCTSCAFAQTCNPADASCQKIKADPECQKNGGYYGASEDQLNVRFHRMKERYGVDPQYPISRYVDGFSKALIPDRNGEHDAAGAYVGTPNCRNPLFAASLPSSAGEELCTRPRGARPKEFIVFLPLVGVPSTLVGAAPDWTKILGVSPGTFDFSGVDSHMIASKVPRPGLPGPSNTRGDNGTDPIHGREWDTSNDDMQFACTFALPAVRVCSANDPSCDCASTRNPPLCSATPGEQIRAKGYPGLRPLQVARELGEQALVGSICPAPGQTDYVATMNALADRLLPKLAK